MAKRVSLQGKGVELFFGSAAEAPAVAEAATGSSPRARSATEPPGQVHVRVHAPVQAVAVDEDDLLRALREKQRLASSTFRFQPEELEQLDFLFDALNRARPRIVSKNDLVRLGVRWLLSDYAANRDRSLAWKLLDRM